MNAPVESADRAATPGPSAGAPAALSALIKIENQFGAHNYEPLPVVLARGEGAGCGTARTALSRHDERLFGGEPRPRPSAHRCRARAPRRGAWRCRRAPSTATGSGRSWQKLCDAHRPRRGAADEHRRRSGRDRDQGGAALGLSGQGHRAGPRRDHRRATAISTAAPRPSSDSRPSRTIATGSGRSRPASARAVRRSRRAASARSRRDTAAMLVEPIQGEAGIIVPPAGWLAGSAAPVRRASRAADPRRGAVRARPHRRVVRLRARGRPARRADRSARRWAAACCRSRPSSARAKSWTCSRRARTARPSAAIRSPPRSGSRRSR